MLFSLIACSKNNASDTNEITSTNTQYSEIKDVAESEATHAPTPTVTINGETATSTPEIIEQATSNQNETFPQPVFKTDNITRISFTTDYGYGDECEVPEKYMTEITCWLGTFTIDEIVPEDVPIPPGTGFYFVKIEYSDGTAVQNSLSTIKIDGISYYMSSAETPECFMEILQNN